MYVYLRSLSFKDHATKSLKFQIYTKIRARYIRKKLEPLKINNCAEANINNQIHKKSYDLLSFVYLNLRW